MNKANNPLDLSCYVAGRKISSGKRLEIHNPFNRRLVGTVNQAGREDTEAAIQAALTGRPALTRFERFSILERTRQLLEERREQFAQLITSESGLCIRETLYETGRASDVLR